VAGYEFGLMSFHGANEEVGEKLSKKAERE